MKAWYNTTNGNLGNRPADAYNFKPAMIGLKLDDGSMTMAYSANVYREAEARKAGKHLDDAYFADMPQEALDDMMRRITKIK